MKTITLDQSIHRMVEQYPEIKDILFEIGFKDIIKPGMLQTAGRLMTLRKGASHKNIDIKTIVSIFREKGFELKGENIHE